MQQKYVEHYIATAFHKWFMRICQECGDTPIRAAIQNYLYLQDPDNPDKVRIQSFISGILELYSQLKDMDDPEDPPIVFEAGLSDTALQAIEALSTKAAQPPPPTSTEKLLKAITSPTTQALIGNN